MKDDTIIGLEIPPDICFAPLLTNTAEILARTRGLDKRGSLRFQLAAEEFFGYLAQVVEETGRIKVVFTGKRHLLRMAFTFKASVLNLGALNFNSVVRVSHDGDIPQDLGLLLAARVTDRCHLTREGTDVFTLLAEVDKVYPEAEGLPRDIHCKPPYRVEICQDPDRLVHAAFLAAARYPVWNFPPCFQTPAKFPDLVLTGHFQAAVTLDAASRPAGLLCWARSGDKGFLFSGPFVFTPDEDKALVARMLTDRFLEAVAREGVEIVFCERPTADVPAGYFEPLGSLHMTGPSGRTEQPVLFRQIKEDAGATVWAHPSVEEFLKNEYDRLAMCREVMRPQPAIEQENKASLLSTMVERSRSLAILRPLLDGGDVAANLAGHVTALREKGIDNILYYMDISHSWEAAIAPALLEAGFKPRLMVPMAGRSDIMVFQHEPAD